MLDPGAATSTTPSPKLENDDRAGCVVRPGYHGPTAEAGAVGWVADDTVTTPGSSLGRSMQLGSRVRRTGLVSSGLVVSTVLMARSWFSLPAAATFRMPCSVV